jgi:DNA polymerase-3 subunit delta'
MPDPRSTNALIGHDGAQARLARAATGPRLHHAWLIAGPRGIGKATLAYRFARWLLAGVPVGAAPDLLGLDPAHGTFRRVAADTHADLLTVELRYDETRKRQKTEIAVDDVRAVTEFLRMTPAEGGWRVVVVDGAEAMNHHAANSLLKVLEDPPPRSVLLLVSHQPGLLLPTLRSRCCRLALQPLADEAMRRALDTLEIARLAPEDLPHLLRLAGGAPGRALVLANADGLAMSRLAEAVLRDLPQLDYARTQEIADQVVRTDTGFSSFFDALRGTMAEKLHAAARGEASALPDGRKLDAWCEIWQSLGRLQRDSESFYMEKRQSVANALHLLHA